MTYQVLARKWRPQEVDTVVGQEPVTRTLRNALVSGRVAHAYLFTGPRGVGKTTPAPPRPRAGAGHPTPAQCAGVRARGARLSLHGPPRGRQDHHGAAPRQGALL